MRGQAPADVAAIGILSERPIRGGEVLYERPQTALHQTALHSRVITEQAKGALAQRPRRR